MKMGLGECVKNDLLHGYPVLTEKKGEIVAEFTYTIAIRNEGPIVISGLNLDKAYSFIRIVFREKISLIIKNLIELLLNNILFLLLYNFILN